MLNYKQAIKLSWEELTSILQTWVKTQFGSHVEAYIERLPNDWEARVKGLTQADMDQFMALYRVFDVNGLYDAEHDWPAEMWDWGIPLAFVCMAITFVLQDFVITDCVAVDDGVFFFSSAVRKDIWVQEG